MPNHGRHLAMRLMPRDEALDPSLLQEVLHRLASLHGVAVHEGVVVHHGLRLRAGGAVLDELARGPAALARLLVLLPPRRGHVRPQLLVLPRVESVGPLPDLLDRRLQAGDVAGGVVLQAPVHEERVPEHERQEAAAAEVEHPRVLRLRIYRLDVALYDVVVCCLCRAVQHRELVLPRAEGRVLAAHSAVQQPMTLGHLASREAPLLNEVLVRRGPLPVPWRNPRLHVVPFGELGQKPQLDGVPVS
mmetsp:Transcript_113262/g.316453  ORF Transcript_113262/g.316453 Transcript_113262/m.316453 type:complete len:246 (-) Transcript_113262:371-1108(-)